MASEKVSMAKAIEILERRYGQLPRAVVKKARARRGKITINVGEDFFGEFDIAQMTGAGPTLWIQVKALSHVAEPRRTIEENIVVPLLEAGHATDLARAHRFQVWAWVSGKNQHDPGYMRGWTWMWSTLSWVEMLRSQFDPPEDPYESVALHA